MFVELREQFTAKQFVDVIDIRSGSYQEALMKKRVLLTGIILFLSLIHISEPTRP